MPEWPRQGERKLSRLFAYFAAGLSAALAGSFISRQGSTRFGFMADGLIFALLLLITLTLSDRCVIAGVKIALWRWICAVALITCAPAISLAASFIGGFGLAAVTGAVMSIFQSSVTGKTIGTFPGLLGTTIVICIGVDSFGLLLYCALSMLRPQQTLACLRVLALVGVCCSILSVTLDVLFSSELSKPYSLARGMMLLNILRFSVEPAFGVVAGYCFSGDRSTVPTS
jgi:hypothetical protein